VRFLEGRAVTVFFGVDSFSLQGAAHQQQQHKALGTCSNQFNDHYEESKYTVDTTLVASRRQRSAKIDVDQSDRSGVGGETRSVVILFFANWLAVFSTAKQKTANPQRFQRIRHTKSMQPRRVLK